MSQHFKNIVLGLGSLTLALLLGEMFLRVQESWTEKRNQRLASFSRVDRLASRDAKDALTPEILRTFNGCLFSADVVKQDPLMGFVNVPDTEGMMVHVDHGTNLILPAFANLTFLSNFHYHTSTFRVNHDGNRGPQTLSPKPPDVYRVIFVGDSVTYGYYVEEDESFVGLVDQALQQANVNGKKVEVINAGVSGLGSAEILAHIERRLLALDPDLIVWGFYLNDIDPNEGDILFPVRDLEAWKFLNHSAIGRLMQRVFFSTQFGAQIKIDGESPANQRIRRAWRRVESNLSEARETLRTKGIGLWVAAFPSGLQLGRPWTTPHYQGRLAQLCTALEVPWLDTLPELERAGDAETLYFKGDLIHPNAQGHQAIARALVRFFLNHLKIKLEKTE